MQVHLSGHGGGERDAVEPQALHRQRGAQQVRLHQRRPAAARRGHQGQGEGVLPALRVQIREPQHHHHQGESVGRNSSD